MIGDSKHFIKKNMVEGHIHAHVSLVGSFATVASYISQQVSHHTRWRMTANESYVLPAHLPGRMEVFIVVVFAILT